MVKKIIIKSIYMQLLAINSLYLNPKLKHVTFKLSRRKIPTE